MTSTLYYDDPNLLEFHAKIVGLDEREGHPAVVLDRSAFYPEGGGQPADRGEIQGVPVVDVRKNDATIYHLLPADTDTDALKPGTAVQCRVDATRRRDYQQQHSGQHVLSAVLQEVGNYATVSVHQGTDHTTIEVDTNSIPPADLEAVERLANAAIEADLPFTAEWATDETIGNFPLRRPPKVSGSIRVVRVGDFASGDELDCVACGGVHVERTGEIRLVRAVGVETIRGRVRIAWKIGDRAIAHYRLCSEIVSRLGASLSAQPDELVERVARQEERSRELEAGSRRLAERVHTLVAEDLVSQAVAVGRQRVVTATFRDEPADFLRGVTERLVAQSGVAGCLVNHAEGRLQWSIGIAPDSSVALDDLRKDFLPIIDGKGGGKPPIWQGIGTKADGVDEFLARFREIAERALGTQPG